MRRTIARTIARAITGITVGSAACGAFLPLPAGSSSAPAADPVVPHFEIEHYRLANGLQVILAPDPAAGDVVLNTWYHVGSRDETAGGRGLAHVYEHLMFKGSLHHPGDFTETIEEIGGRSNATTDRDRTAYWTIVPAEHLEPALWLESDRMGYLPEALTPAKLARQIEIVLNELRRLENRPYGGADDALYRLLYPCEDPCEHPYGHPVGGDPADLAAATVDDAIAFFRRWYVPGNASLCVAGRFDPAQARAWISKYYGPLRGEAPRRSLPQPSDPSGPRRAVRQDDVELQRLILAWPGPARYRPGDAECDVLAQLLGTTRGSRLDRALRSERRLAQEIRVRQRSRELSSTFEIEITIVPGADPQDVEAAVDSVLQDILEQGLEADEVETARTVLEADFLRSLERLDGFGSLANVLNRYAAFVGEPDWIERDLQRLRACTPGSVAGVVRRHLGPGRHVALRIDPGTRPTGPPMPEPTAPSAAGETSSPSIATPHATDVFDRSLRPEPAAVIPFRAPGIRSGELENGLRFHLVHSDRLPLVEAHLVIPGGWAVDGERPGVCALTARMLAEGAAGLDAARIGSAAGRIGAELECRSNFDASWVRINMPRVQVGNALRLLADVALRPDFSGDAFERRIDRERGRRRMEAARPRTVAIQRLQREIFPADHPYARSFTGSVDSTALALLAPDDLRAFHARWYRPDNAHLVLVGDLDLDRAEALARRHFGAWRRADGQPAMPPALPPVPDRAAAAPSLSPAGPRIVLLDRPGSSQTTVVGGCATVARSDPRRKTLQALNLALGGGESSRLNRNLRQDRGLTYGVRSRMVNYRQAGLFLIETDTQPDRTGEALSELLREMRRIGREQPLQGDELKRTVTVWEHAFARRFETLEATASGVDRILVCGLPADDWSRRPPLFATDRPDRWAELARAWAPEHMTWVLVGDVSALRADLAAHGIIPDELGAF